MPVVHDVDILSNVNAIPLIVGGSPTLIVSLSIQNLDDNAYVYIGNSEVSSTSFGIRIDPGGLASFDGLRKDTHFYAISSVNGSQISKLAMVFE